MKSNYMQNFIATAFAAVLGLATARAADVTPAETKAIAVNFPKINKEMVKTGFFDYLDFSHSQ